MLEILDRAAVPYELIPHERSVTAVAEARTVGVEPDEVAKTIVIETQQGAVRAVLPASQRLDLRKLRSALDVRGKPRLATEDELARDYPEFELGAVPPLGGAHADRVLVDCRVVDHDSLVLEAGSHEHSVRLRAQDLLALTGASVADICSDR
jgi:Ala-tRNA(Pro) deacylase